MPGRLVTICAVISLVAPLGLAAGQASREEKMSKDMREAIAFQRLKDNEDRRQAAIEARHPTVTYGGADRKAEEPSTQGRKVPDPGEKQSQPDKR